jgi:hypothetical protein
MSTNAWINHVKEYAAKNECKYSEALKAAKATYKKPEAKKEVIAVAKNSKRKADSAPVPEPQGKRQKKKRVVKARVVREAAPTEIGESADTTESSSSS